MARTYSTKAAGSTCQHRHSPASLSTLCATFSCQLCGVVGGTCVLMVRDALCALQAGMFGGRPAQATVR